MEKKQKHAANLEDEVFTSFQQLIFFKMQLV